MRFVGTALVVFGGSFRLCEGPGRNLGFEFRFVLVVLFLVVVVFLLWDAGLDVESRNLV